MLIATAGMAATTAIMQFAGTDGSGNTILLISLGLFFLALLLCFAGMAGLIGQATLESPNIYVLNIRLPTLLAFFITILAFFAFAYGAYRSTKVKPKSDVRPGYAQFEPCRVTATANSKSRLACYDSIFDVELKTSPPTIEQISALSPEDRAWIALLIERLPRSK